MSVKHPQKNRLVPPPDFEELHLQCSATESRPAAASVHVQGAHAVASTVFRAAPAVGSALGAARRPLGDAGGSNGTLCGFGSFHVAVEGYVRGTLPVHRPRTVFLTSTAARIRAYYEAMPEVSRTRRLVPPSVGQRPSLFNTPILREALNFALSAGGAGLSTDDQRSYVSLLLMVEAGGSAPQAHGTRRAVVRGSKRPRPHSTTAGNSGVPVGTLQRHGVVSSDEESSEGERGELARAFHTKSAFVTAVRGEQRRVLSKLCWDETPLEMGGTTYLFYSRDLLLVVLDLLHNARHVQLWGEELGMAPDGTRLRSDIMDSDLFLSEEVNVRRRHGSLSFLLAVQLFLDEAVVSWSGAHYMYPARARVLNVRDRSVQWVTVAYIPHVGKPVAQTAAARLRASDNRNGVLQRCLAILLRRFIGASQDGVHVVFPGQRPLTAVPRLIGLVADQLGERSVVCLMGNACEFFCSHCIVRRDVAGGPGGVGADARDVTAVLDAQIEGAITRDGDPRPSLRGHLRTEHSALAFVPAIGAVWGLATDNKRLYDIISFDLLHVWKLGIVRMLAQRFPSFLRVACGSEDARLGPVPATLEALNLRAWEMGHLCVPSPTPPGYVLTTVSFFLLIDRTSEGARPLTIALLLLFTGLCEDTRNPPRIGSHRTAGFRGATVPVAMTRGSMDIWSGDTAPCRHTPDRPYTCSTLASAHVYCVWHEKVFRTPGREATTNDWAPLATRPDNDATYACRGWWTRREPPGATPRCRPHPCGGRPATVDHRK